MYLVARLVGILHVKIIKFCNGVMSRREEEGDDRVKIKKNIFEFFHEEEFFNTLNIFVCQLSTFKQNNYFRL